MGKLRVGLVGAGYWSMYHLNAWSKVEDAELYALCDRSEEKLQTKAKEYFIPDELLFRSIDDMLKSDEIDIVDIVTGPDSHVELVTKAAKAKKAILCQKPFASSMDEIMQMVNAAEEAGVPLMVTENWRYNAPFQVAKKVLDEGIVGDIIGGRYFHANNFSLNMVDRSRMIQPYFKDMKRLLFYELGTHLYDTSVYLFGMPKRVTAVFNRISPHVIGDDNGTVILGYDDYNVTIDASWATRRAFSPAANETDQNIQDESVYIDGTKGSLLLEHMGNGRPDNAIVAFVDTNGKRRILSDDVQYNRWDAIQMVTQNFVNGMLKKDSFATDGKFCASVMNILFKAYESSETGKTVEI